ncbi:MAG: ABC transporter substrate-binding protein [Ktedonobacteraceae bacterium]
MRRLLGPLLILFVLALSACGGGNSGGGSGGGGGGTQGLAGGNNYIGCPSSTNTSAAAAESGNITLTVSGFTSTPAEDALVQSNLNKFTAAHPNIKINWAPIPGDYATKMRANIASGNVADVFYVTPQMGSQYTTSGKLLNLSPYMAKDNVKPDSYYSSLLTPFTCKNGNVYGLPKDWNSLGVFYNKKLFQAAGVAFPTANWTWDDMRADAKKLTKPGSAATSQYGITLNPDPSRWGAFLFAAGGSVLNKDGSQAAFNSQAGVNALNFYSSFQKDGSSVIPTNVSAGWPGEAFGKQRAAMALEGGWLIPYMAETYPGVDYDIAPVPSDPATGKRADLIYTNAWGAYGSTKHPEAAWELIKYMTGSDVQSSQLHAGFALPSLKSLANDSYFTSHPGVKVMFDAAQYGYADSFGPHDDVIHTKIGDAIEKVLLGKADPTSALNDAANQVNNELGV